MSFPNVQGYSAQMRNLTPTDETTKVFFDDKGEAGKVITVPPLDRAESEGFVKHYDPMGWRCGLCVGQMEANGVVGRIECKRCGTAAYFKSAFL